MLRHMMQTNFRWWTFRLVPMSAALQRAEVQELFGGDFGFVIVTGRNHTMERCVVMPLSKGELLETAAHLAIAAVKRRGDRAGDYIVFLPGIGEIVDVQHRIKSVVEACKILILHGDLGHSAVCHHSSGRAYIKNALFWHYSASGDTDHTRVRKKPGRPHCACEVWPRNAFIRRR